MIVCACSNKQCGKSFTINTLNNEYFKFGAVCPWCNRLISKDELLEGILKANKTTTKV